MKNYFHWMTKVFMTLTALVFIGSFSSLQAKNNQEDMPGVERIEKATIELVKQQKPVPGVGPFSVMIVDPFEASDEYKKDYTDAIGQFQVALVSDLKKQNVFAKVLDGGNSTDAKTVKVTGKIVNMRIASSGARIWGGAMAGSSYMDIYVKVTDVKTGKVIVEKIIASYNNAMGAAWTGGSSDKTLPMDMGQIISAYLCTVIPSK